ncbi:MAG TPA: methylated-DNA--[protein]-cysteine S-methyltransferase [Candidatus Binataceae bacterium]|nr:methylated-DNA--[protein]-cysteine S-methyltransferase [Candidatus Binataceae bacterium]
MHNHSNAKSIGNEPELNDAAVDEMLRDAHVGISRVLWSIKRPVARAGEIPSPIGKLFFAESDRGLAAIHFLFSGSGDRTIDRLRRKFELVENEPASRRIATDIRRYFDGDIAVTQRPVDLRIVESDFQRRALEKLRTVPAGSVISYSGLAAAVGKPDSQRAIGNTMASNPVPIFVPCHRVVRSDGSIGNYGGGVPNKVRMLRIEGFKVGPGLRIGPRAVFGNRANSIFCRPECPSATDSGLIFADADAAIRAGLRACRRCMPA